MVKHISFILFDRRTNSKSQSNKIVSRIRLFEIKIVKCSQNLGQQINILSEIRVFGLKDEMPLNDIFERMFQLEKGQSARVKPKASKDELESYFFEVFQDYDEDRVYSSDIKKIIQWYNLLLESKQLKFKLSKEENSSEMEEA